MPIYEYACEFGHLLEEYQSIKEFDKSREVTCPECGNIMQSVINGGIGGFVEGEITTVGQLGEKNWNNLGKTRQQEKRGQMEESRKNAEKQLAKESGIDISKIPDNKKLKTLASLNADQKRRYVQTGKLPPGK